jgi:glycosyltransferase involved in cell wall biosynthesis
MDGDPLETDCMTQAGQTIDLSVVAPVYNELENLDQLVDELLRTLEPQGFATENILVNDGSSDGSSQKIAELAAKNRGVRGLHFKDNRGQTAAFDAGFKAARGRWIVTIDADLQNDPRDIPRLLGALDQNDAAVGFRRVREDGWLRRISSRIANAVRNRLSGDDIIDTGCSLKAFRRECLASLKLFAGMHRFLPTLVQMEGYRVTQLPVNHRPRVKGQSKYGVWNRAFRSLNDLLAVRWMKKRRLDYEVIRHEP